MFIVAWIEWSPFFAHSVNWSKLLKKTPLVWTLNWKVKLEMNCWSNLVIVTETFLLVFGYRGQQMQQVYFVRYDKAKETTTEPLLEKVWTSYQQQTTLLSAISRGKNVFSIVMKCMKWILNVYSAKYRWWFGCFNKYQSLNTSK